MPDLDFNVERAEAQRHSATPLLVLKLRIDQAPPLRPIHAIALHCQIRIEPGRRGYTDPQRQSLFELFGPAGNWGQSLRPMLWTHASAMVGGFDHSTLVDLPVPCSYDFNIATTKYFDAIGDDGEVPLCLLFSGTVFYQADDGALQTAPISWNKEAEFRLPARVWREMMDQHYPNSAWLCVNKDLFDRLRRYKARCGHLSLDHALEDLLQNAEEQVLG